MVLSKTHTTFPRLLVKNAARYKDRTAMREKYKGIWQEISWETYLSKVKFFALGLSSLGLNDNDQASILGENCPEWLFSDLAIQALGCISVGIYPSNSPDQVKYILDHSKSKIVIVKDQEQADKVLSIKDSLPDLNKIIVIDIRGLRHYDDPHLLSWQEIEERGRLADRNAPHAFNNLVEKTKSDHVAFLVYTSGTTGPPKGAMITHRNAVHMIAKGLQPILKFTDKDTILSYLPLCHILERNLSMAMPLVFGYTINFAESIDTVQENIREISPTFFAAVPRILEKIHSTVKIKLENTTRFKRTVYNFWEPVGITSGTYRMKKKRLPFFQFLTYSIGYLLSYRAVRDKIGLLKCRCIMSGGAPIAPEVLSFFRSLGINTVEMYGLTETCGTVSGPHDKIKNNSVGEPCKALELRLADDGEILLKGDSVFVGYFRDPGATEEAIRDGWLHTGDIGKLDEDGHLYIIDRKKDIIITSGGKNISPSEIENKIKCSPYIKEAVVIGDGRKYLTALIQIEYDNVGNWAQNNKIAYTTYKSLATEPAVFNLINTELEHANDKLARVEAIKKFKVLEKELDQDDEELTATQKVKRKVIADRFEKEIMEMYGEIS